MKTILLLIVSNTFMTMAWYGHLKHTDKPLWLVVLASWAIAFVEYCFAVPANRLGAGQFTVTQLKTIQEVITLLVFAVFVTVAFGEKLGWNHLAGFACLVLGTYFIFAKAG